MTAAYCNDRKRYDKKIIILGLSLLLIGCASYPQQRLYKAKPAFYSYIIGDANTDRIDTDYAADVYATPASCQKIITAMVALKLLGPEYRYRTELLVANNKSSAQDVVISFSGDPTFTYKDLLELLQPLQGTIVEKRIILDASAFTTPAHSNNIMLDDIGSDYAQPVSAMNIDQNLMTIKVSPTYIGEMASTQIDSADRIVSNIKTTAAASAIRLIWNGNILHASGNINPNDPSLEFHRSPREIQPYIINKVASALKELNISGNITIVYDNKQFPPNLRLINKIESQALKTMLISALKKSDNLVFDSLYLKMLHAQRPDGVRNWSDGDKIIKQSIQRYFSIDVGNAFFVDGSGLSRYNRLQPKTLFALLKQGWRIPELMAALPRPGEQNSTLEKRSLLPRHIKAKTGNMSGISCLCGYSSSARTPKAFVIMVDSFAPPAKELFDVIDQFIQHQLGEPY